MIETLNKAITEFKEIGGEPYAIILPSSFGLGIKKEFDIEKYQGLIVYKGRTLASEFCIVSKQDFERIKKFEDDLEYLKGDVSKFFGNIGDIN